ncbi:hypothetical protein RCO48_38815 [Peribacillus frigoritolerans]|nr:hypothetical protein [Peribacillus frigoritolerans]
MDQSKWIQKIEELSLNALPAMQTQIYDGWVIRFCGWIYETGEFHYPHLSIE